jgi:hypothetical protein
MEMAFKFSVGQAVEYKPLGNPAGLFKVIQRMPKEDNTTDQKYRIKSLQEGFERTVAEVDLSPADMAEGAYQERTPPGARGR